MDRELIPRTPDDEEESEREHTLSLLERNLLWDAICEAARQLRSRPAVCLKSSNNPVRASDPVPSVKDWKLAEALALLCVLLGAGAVHTQSVSLFAALRALTISEKGRRLHLWYQRRTRGHVTNLGATPDIAATVRADCDPTGGNIQRVIEVKRVRQLGAALVRQEFGKAFDLNVCSYCLLTYYQIPPKIRSGADRFGLDVAELFIKPDMQPAELVSHVCERLKRSGNEERFATHLKSGYADYQRRQLAFNP
jgi:hypothetical protein